MQRTQLPEKRGEILCSSALHLGSVGRCAFPVQFGLVPRFTVDSKDCWVSAGVVHRGCRV